MSAATDYDSILALERITSKFLRLSVILPMTITMADP
jgi:hypothetical protein